ncbi:FAD-dependent monooxygenase [Caulobacter hibisci]|uniref:FAD-dependent monooxygenase n=1 Tax=Caulobacter hibisci TaxID=2035993 RepID=A0ABS0SWZ5_9CAUL|nr:FAD-dependent monooxygenase [Caulobacter hibisci]MBI1684113.1 FAD-dependent monooxygenase [Caulobacter hibisci]
MTPSHTSPVVVAGAGPVGMSTAIALALRGVDVIVVEPRTAGQPPSAKCNTVAARTMEIFRQFGVADAVRAAGLPDDYPTDTIYCTSISGPELTRLTMPARNEREKPGFLDSAWRTPEPMVRVSQLYLEPILFERLKRTPEITVLNETAVERYEQDAEGVTVHCRRQPDGEAFTIRTQYLVGCDGGRSPIRKAMGVKLVGDAELGRTRSTLIRAPGLKALFGKRRPAWMSWVVNDKVRGNVVAIDGRDTWLVHRSMPAGVSDYDALDFDQSIRDVLGVGQEFTWEVLNHEDWIGRRLVAERFRDGRVFIAGDAAHLWVPFAGYGMNAGIADGVNLAWTLAAAVNGWAEPAIVDAYEAERHPITEQVSKFAMRKVIENVEAMGKGNVPAALAAKGPVGMGLRALLGKKLYDINVPQFAPEGLNFGYFYDRSPIIAYDGEAPPTYTMGEITPSTVPGCRMPHFWLGERSVYDELDLDYTLVRFDPSVSVEPLVAAAAAAGLPLKVLDAPKPDLPKAFKTALLIVRHDQQVVWRGDAVPGAPGDLVQVLRGAMSAQPSQLVASTG